MKNQQTKKEKRRQEAKPQGFTQKHLNSAWKLFTTLLGHKLSLYRKQHPTTLEGGSLTTQNHLPEDRKPNQMTEIQKKNEQLLQKSPPKIEKRSRGKNFEQR